MRHKRSNHLNIKTVVNLGKNSLVADLPKIEFSKDNTCSACQMEKQLDLRSKTKDVLPQLDVWNCFIWTYLVLIPVTSLREMKYNVVIIDDYSR